MLITLKRMAISGFSSTLSLAIVSWSACSAAISLEDRGDHLARPAPLGPEVDEDGLVEPRDGLVEGGGGEGDDAMRPWSGPFGVRTDDATGVERRPGEPAFLEPSVDRRTPAASARCSVWLICLEPALGVDGGHAARAGGGDRLAVGVVLHVAAGEDAVDVGVRRAGLGDEVAVVVHVEHALEQVGVGPMADGDEQAGDRQRVVSGSLRPWPVSTHATRDPRSIVPSSSADMSPATLIADAGSQKIPASAGSAAYASSSCASERLIMRPPDSAIAGQRLVAHARRYGSRSRSSPDARRVRHRRAARNRRPASRASAAVHRCVPALVHSVSPSSTR